MLLAIRHLIQVRPSPSLHRSLFQARDPFGSVTLRGSSLADVQRNLGHSTPVLTSETYGHIGEDHRIREADERLTLESATYSNKNSSHQVSKPLVWIVIWRRAGPRRATIDLSMYTYAGVAPSTEKVT
jgi:hypothetical protein